MTLEDVMEEMELGPNGCATHLAWSPRVYCWPFLTESMPFSHQKKAASSARVIRRGLLYCMEYLEESLGDWLGQELQASPSKGFAHPSSFIKCPCFVIICMHLQGLLWMIVSITKPCCTEGSSRML